MVVHGGAGLSTWIASFRVGRRWDWAGEGHAVHGGKGLGECRRSIRENHHKKHKDSQAKNDKDHGSWLWSSQLHQGPHSPEKLADPAPRCHYFHEVVVAHQERHGHGC